MPRESIGQCGCAQWPDKRWITAELDLAICYLRHACGAPPPGYELEIIWHEHDLGEYATIGVTWEGPADAPWDYISRAESALMRFDAAVSWSELGPEDEMEGGEENESAEETTDEEHEEGDGERSDKLLEPRELYRKSGMLELTAKDWLTALALFQEGGWEAARPMGLYINPLSFVMHDEGEAMQRAGQAIFKKIDEEPVLCTGVPMDLGLFYQITEFVGGGAFIVGRKGAYENAKANDWS